VRAQYRNYDSNASDNQIKPGIRLVNGGTTAVSLSAVKVRYWFTKDAGATTFAIWCDYAFLGCGSVTRSIVPVSPARTNADHYLEVGWTGGTLAAGANTGDLQLRLNKTDWSAFNEANDFSRGTSTNFTDSTTVTVYVNGTRVWGNEP
jgi:hypothetical protein